MNYGVLLVHTGFPDNCSYDSIREYIEALYDHDTLAVSPAFLFKQRLKRTIIPSKAKRWQAHLQRQFDGAAQADSNFPTPYHAGLASLTEKLEASICGSSGEEIRVTVGLRFGSPSIEGALLSLKGFGCSNIIVVPLYPARYAPRTNAAIATVGHVLETMSGKPWKPRLTTVESFANSPVYLKALTARIYEDWTPGPLSRVLVVFPSLPQVVSKEDSSYTTQIDLIMSGIEKHGAIKDERLKAAFLCDFDNDKWLNPFAEKTLLSWGCGAINDLKLVSPVFALDSPELACDIEERLTDYFLKNANGLNLQVEVVPALDDNDLYVDALGSVICKVIKAIR